MTTIELKTIEMHTGGGPVRILHSGYPEIEEETILKKRRYAHEKLDHLRKFLMLEPRGHYDMFGVILVSVKVCLSAHRISTPSTRLIKAGP